MASTTSSANTTPRWTTDNLGPLLWIDLETTGLNPLVSTIAEVAMVTTTWDYTHKATLVNTVVHLTEEEIKSAVPFVTKMHTSNGLFDDCRKTNLTLKELDLALAQNLDSAHPERVRGVEYQTLRPWHPAGSSVHFDVAFIKKHLPRVAKRLSHQILDVTSFGLRAKAKKLKRFNQNKGDSSTHRALPDIENSIELMVYYEQELLK